MTIKAETDNIQEENKIEYPCIMKSKNTNNIVLFEQAGKGTVLKIGKTPTANCVGEISYDVAMSHFELFTGKITLRNK